MQNKRDTSGGMYLDAVLAAEARCELETDNWVTQARGRRFPRAIDLLGQTMEIFEKAACCYWGCRNPSHDLERFAARLHQPEGAIVVMCSLVRAVGWCAVVLAQIMNIPPEQSAALVVLGAELETVLGGHTAASMRERVKALANR